MSKKDQKNKQEAASEEPVTPETEKETAEQAEQTAEQAAKDTAAEAAGKEEEKKAEPTPEELLAQANDRYLRARADFENYRKRMSREFSEIRENSKQQTISEFLTVYDFFILAIEASNKTPDIKVIKQGMDMILTEFQKTFENLGVTIIDAAGKTFDPLLHDAVAQEPSETVEEGKIIRQWKPGFKVGDKLLRPATVVVSSGAPKAEETAAADGDAAPEQK